MSAEIGSSAPETDGWLSPELAHLANAHAAVAEAIGRMMRALSTGRDTQIGIERLRLETTVDQYRTWAMDIDASLAASDEDKLELRLRLSQIQSEFRAALQGKAAELASACSAVVEAPVRIALPSDEGCKRLSAGAPVMQRIMRRIPRLAFPFAVVAFGFFFAGTAWAEEARPLTLYPMPAPTPDVLWGPPTAPQHGFAIAPGAGNGQALPKVRRAQQDGLVAKPGPVRMLYVETEEGALQMRAEPTLDAAPRGAYPTGTRMIVLEDDGAWLRVLAPDGRWGWMAAEFLAETATLEAER